MESLDSINEGLVVGGEGVLQKKEELSTPVLYVESLDSMNEGLVVGGEGGVLQKKRNYPPQ